MAKHTNQFKDSFSILTTVKDSIKDLKVKVNQALNKTLPSRVLSKANIFNTAIDVSADLANTVLLHVEDSLVEQNIDVAQKELSVRGLATLSGHQSCRPLSSTGVISIKLKPEIQLIAGPKLVFANTTFVCAQNNLTYSMINKTPRVISTSDELILVDIIEGSYETMKIVAEGKSFEKIKLDSIGAIENDNIKVFVNGEQWKKIDSLYEGSPISKTWYSKNGIDSQVDIIFGNNVYGKQLQEGDVIEVTMLITSGELGNVDNNATWSSSQGIYDTSGNNFDISEYSTISVWSGFVMGSNGEHIETTRSLAGYNSRSLAFIRAENLKAYLSRLSILSHIDAWTLEDDLVFNVIALPNITNKLSTYYDYFNLSDADISLTTNQKNELINFIEKSQGQIISSEIILHDPVFEKYAIMVYIDAIFVDKKKMKMLIYESIAKVMLESTFIDVEIGTIQSISETEFLRELILIDEINGVNIDILSERNELARINGTYEIIETSYVGSVKQLTKVIKTVLPTENPNLGFNELGGIQTIDRKSIPILRSGFLKYNGDDDSFVLDKPIYIFYKTNNGYEEL